MPRISVGVRIRPEVGVRTQGIESFAVQAENKSIDFQVAEVNHSFQFDNIFQENASQEQVFQASTSSIIDAALEGYNGTVFAYGQTGAGKTHTMCGSLDKSVHEYGICALTSLQLFDTARKLHDTSLSFRLSILEIYNESLVDLLDHSTQHKLNVIETEGGVVVPGLRISPISSTDEALNLILEAQANRAVAEHNLNLQSSRSHLIYTFYITRTKARGPQVEPEVHQSKLHVVDLAGSERTNKTGSTGAVQKEANYINKSLSYLEQVVIALTQTNREHIPFRQSKLTYLLKDSLGGNGNTYLIACIWPRKDHVWETLSTLRFAARMKAIEMHPVRNRLVAKEQGGNNKALQNQIEMLKKELALRDSVHNQEVWLPDMSKAQRQHTYKTCAAYVEQCMEVNTVDDVYASLQLNSLSQACYMIHMLSKALHSVCNEHQEDVQSKMREQMILGEQGYSDNGADIVDDILNRQQRVCTAEGVHQDVESSNPIIQANRGEGGEDSQQAAPIEEIGEKEREKLFAQYCNSYGKQLFDAFESTKETLKESKSRQKEIVSIVNATKQRIDALTEALQKPDEESELEEIKQHLSLAKKSYRAAYEEFTICKEQIQETQNLKSRAMAALINAFNEHFNSNGGQLGYEGDVDGAESKGD